MKISAVKDINKRKTADCLIVPFFEGKVPRAACVLDDIERDLKWPIKMGDFCGKKNQTILLYAQGKKENRILLLGLGKEDQITQESLRISLTEAIKVCQKLKTIKSINCLFPQKCKIKNSYQTVLEGLYLPNYFFHHLKKDSLKEEKPSLIEDLTLVGVKLEETLIHKTDVIITGVHMVRDLVNSNADDATPQKLEKVAKELGKNSSKMKVVTFDKQRIVKEKLDLLLAVNRGSFRDPAFIVMDYHGNSQSKEKTVLIGKGVTYDSGGLSLKPTESMDSMKSDMAGAAIVLGLMYCVSKLNLKQNITAIIPATENSIGSKSYKPGDVYSSYSEKKVEVVNTDAEGRLILADALSYAVDKIKPKRIIDVATLTGAISIALGEEIAGLFTNDEKLGEELKKSSENTGEIIWQLPLYQEYKKMLKSEIADLKNVGNRSGGAITAALFLEEFVKKTTWAHLDIAATSYCKPKGYCPTLATGFGLRLLFDFLENL